MRHSLKPLSLVICIAAASIPAAIGQSAIITLQFPYGARSTGMAETFTGIANNADATFYNPAGLGQAPLANTWRPHFPVPAGELTAITSPHRKGFGGRDRVWVGTKTEGLKRYNGRVWETYEPYVIEEGDSITTIASRIFQTEDPRRIARAVKRIKDINHIGVATEAAFTASILSRSNDSLRSNPDYVHKVEERVAALAAVIPDDRTTDFVKQWIAGIVPVDKADTVATEISLFRTDSDRSIAELVELKIPFNAVIDDKITALCVDAADRLWIGTDNGLWSYDGTVWKQFTRIDGLPADSITTIASGTSGTIAVATRNGAALWIDGAFKPFGADKGITAAHCIAVSNTGTTYIGTSKGLTRIDGDSLTVIDSLAGLISSTVTAVAIDGSGNLWTGGPGGVAIFNGSAWKRYKFPGSTITCFAPTHADRMWIGTDKGAIYYETGRSVTADNGTKTAAPRWRPYHGKNALKGNNVRGITLAGKDVWLVTEEAVNQYDKGDISTTFFWEPLLPALKLNDLWHAAVAGVMPTEEWGTIGMFFNYLNFGENQRTDAWGKELGKYNAGEFVVGVSYGLPLKQDLSAGVNIKFARSKLTDDKSAIGRTFALDAAVLKRNLFIDRLDAGLTIMNMGPSVSYASAEAEKADPIPFAIRAGLSYTPIQTPLHSLLLAVDADREIVKKHPTDPNDPKAGTPYPFWQAVYYDLIDDTSETATDEFNQIVFHVGIEYWYLNFIALRTGYMYDKAGDRKEIPIGIGLRYGNFGIDWSYIISPDKRPRNGQWRFSAVFNP